MECYQLPTLALWYILRHDQNRTSLSYYVITSTPLINACLSHCCISFLSMYFIRYVFIFLFIYFFFYILWSHVFLICVLCKIYKSTLSVMYNQLMNILILTKLQITIELWIFMFTFLRDRNCWSPFQHIYDSGKKKKTNECGRQLTSLRKGYEAFKWTIERS